MACWVGALFSKIDVTIVDSTVIDEFPASIEDGRLRRYAHLAFANEQVPRIAECSAGIGVILKMFLDFRNRQIGMRIDQPKRNPFLMKVCPKPGHGRGVAI